MHTHIHIHTCAYMTKQPALASIICDSSFWSDKWAWHVQLLMITTWIFLVYYFQKRSWFTNQVFGSPCHVQLLRLPTCIFLVYHFQKMWWWLTRLLSWNKVTHTHKCTHKHPHKWYHLTLVAPLSNHTYKVHAYLLFSCTIQDGWRYSCPQWFQATYCELVRAIP